MMAESIPDCTKIIGGIWITKFEEIESRAWGNSESRIPVYYYDFDALTQGLARGGLIILGGRPAMGKTALSLNMALYVSKTYNLPIYLFHIEINKDQISNRFLSMELGIEFRQIKN